jgi:O-antigen ligase
MTAGFRDRWFDGQRLALVADQLALGVALSLPWSTTATGILIVLWLIALLPTLSPDQIRREMMTAAGGLPVLLWLLGAVGMLWADVAWSERFGGLDGFDRLLAIPLLLAQFRRSENGMLVLYGFLASAICLLAASWAFALIPVLRTHGKFPGVPVKDYIFQSGEFLICGFVLFGAALDDWRHQRRSRSLLLTGLAMLFLVNIAFVFASRTSLMVMPFLVAALGWRYYGRKGAVLACAIAAVLAPLLWLSSPHLRAFTLQSLQDLRGYYTANQVTSSGLHVEFLRKSLRIVETAPAFGHGTGSITEEFHRAAAGETGAAAIETVNPHNQIFAVAIQLGCLGAAVLIAMWIAHLMLFRGAGLAAWAGMVVVIENIVSSIANSHLFDYSQGWLYVFGVGVAGGMVLRKGEAATRRV